MAGARARIPSFDAEILVLCDTNGGRLPHEVAEITRSVAAVTAAGGK